jgi:hypothetical protein
MSSDRRASYGLSRLDCCLVVPLDPALEGPPVHCLRTISQQGGVRSSRSGRSGRVPPGFWGWWSAAECQHLVTVRTSSRDGSGPVGRLRRHSSSTEARSSMVPENAKASGLASSRVVPVRRPWADWLTSMRISIKTPKKGANLKSTYCGRSYKRWSCFGRTTALRRQKAPERGCPIGRLHGGAI